jgi:hypothetical protein
MGEATRVLAGDTAILAPLDAPPGAQQSGDWLESSDARLLQHQLVHAAGWMDPPSIRSLHLQAPLPAYLEQIATRLTLLPGFDGQPPTSCDIYACEEGEQPPQCPSGACAILTLHSACSWVCTLPDGTCTTLAIPPRALTLLPATLSAHRMLPATERVMSLRFSRPLDPK